MAVRYEAPGPANFGSIYGGRGRGVGLGGGGGSDNLQVVQLRDDTARLQNQLALQGQAARADSTQIAQQGAVRGALQLQAAELDAWQYQQSVTEQEAMQLRRDQNAIAAIDADSTLSPLEKMQAKTRIKTRIDWVSERQNRDLQAAQVQMVQMHANAYQQRAELDNARLKRSADLLEDNIRFDPDPTQRDLAEKAVDTLNPELKANPGAREQAIRDYMERNGMGTRLLQQPDGKWETKPWEKSTKGEGTKNTGSGATKEPTQSFLTREAEAFMKQEGVKPDMPEYASKLKAKVAELKAEHQAKTPEGQAQAQRQRREAAIGKIDAMEQTAFYAAESILPPAEKSAVITAINRMRQLIDVFGPPEQMKPEARQQLDAAADHARVTLARFGLTPDGMQKKSE